MIVPDKRFTFDHYLPLTRVSEILAARAEERETHTSVAVIAHCAETTHNVPLRHWIGIHAPTGMPPYIERLRAALELLKLKSTDYIDVHGWHFTPSSFLAILETLSEMKLIGFEVERIYGTSFGSMEFFAVLRKGQDRMFDQKY